MKNKLTASEYKALISPNKRKRKVNKISKPLLHGYESKPLFVVGIDPGYKIDKPNTGFAIMRSGNQIKEAKSLFTWQAIFMLHELVVDFGAENIVVVVEDPKSWVMFKGTNKASAEARKASKGGLQAIFNQFYTFCRASKVDCHPCSVQGLKLYDDNMFRATFKYEDNPLPDTDSRAAASFVYRGNYFERSK